MFETRILSQDEILLRVAGSMTGESVARFETALTALLNSRYRRITLDLSQVGGVSSLFIGHIMHAHAKLAAENRQVRICGYQESVGDILRMIGVDKVVATQKDALREASGPG